MKIAIHYIGEANRGGAFMLMIDDFFVGQEETATTAKARRSKAIDGVNKYFQVFLDGAKVGETTSTSYIFKNLTARETPYVLGVKGYIRWSRKRTGYNSYIYQAFRLCKSNVQRDDQQQHFTTRHQRYPDKQG